VGNSLDVLDHAFENDRFPVSQMFAAIEQLPLSLAVTGDWAWAIEPEPFIEESARSALRWVDLVQTHLRDQVEILQTALCDLSGEVAVLRVDGRWCVLAGGGTGEDEHYAAMTSLEEGGILAAAGSSSSDRQFSEPGSRQTRPVGSVAARAGAALRLAINLALVEGRALQVPDGDALVLLRVGRVAVGGGWREILDRLETSPERTQDVYAEAAAELLTYVDRHPDRHAPIAPSVWPEMEQPPFGEQVPAAFCVLILPRERLDAAALREAAREAGSEAERALEKLAPVWADESPWSYSLTIAETPLLCISATAVHGWHQALSVLRDRGVFSAAGIDARGPAA
jgi:hypothetical protein